MRDTRQPAPIKRRASAYQYAVVQQMQSPVTDVDDVSELVLFTAHANEHPALCRYAGQPGYPAGQ